MLLIHLVLSASSALTQLQAEDPASSAPAVPPNIILFMVDDLGWVDTEPYGSQYYRTPNIQRLADQSMRFTDAYSESLCCPTRASVLTGQYAARHGMTHGTGHLRPHGEGFTYMPKAAAEYLPLRTPFGRNRLGQSHVTIAEALRAAGYRTGHFGKWHVGVERGDWPEASGFDVAWHAEPSAGPPGFYFSPYGVLPPETADVGVGQVRGTITDGEDGEYITDRVTDEALAFIESSGGRPFFLNLWHYGVHSPWGHKEAYTKAFAEAEDPTGRQGNPIMASMIQSLDESLGRVMQKLDELGIAEGTLLIFYSDNGGNVHSNLPGRTKDSRKRQKGGEMLRDYRRWAGDLPPTNNAPLRGGKGTLYEGGIRVPLIVRWPGQIKAQSVSHEVVGAVDIYPTLMAAAGAPPSAAQDLDGLSILPVLRGEASLDRDAYFAWQPHSNMGASVRMGHWKMIRRLRPAPSHPGLHQLFRLDRDPGESRNLALEEPDKLRELDARIDQFLRDTGAIYPQPNPHHLAFQLPEAARGVVPEQCSLSHGDGVLTVTTRRGTPTLRLAPRSHKGPMICQLEIRGDRAAEGLIRWTEEPQWVAPAQGQSASFQFGGTSEWEKVAVKLAVEGTSREVRIQLGERLEEASIELRSIRLLEPGTGAWIKAWEF